MLEVRFPGSLPFRGLGQWRRIVNWREIQLRKLANVEVITETRLDARAIREYGAELVIVATGARWAAQGICSRTHQPIPGADSALAHVLTPAQLVVERKPAPGRRVTVYDGEGDFMGTCLAEKLALDGYSVDYVTPLDKVSPLGHARYEGAPVKRCLHERGVRMHTGTLVTRVAGGGLLAEDEYGQRREIETDAVVLVTHRVSNSQLYKEMIGDRAALAHEGVEAVYRVGGCVAPVQIPEAIFDGHRLGREIDPSVPRPYRREQVTVDLSV